MPTMPSRPSSGAVAPRRDASTSPLDDKVAGAPADAPRPASPRPKERRPRIVVKTAPPAASPAAHAGGVVPLDYPIQPNKVQAPPLRDDTLARDRLLDWLSVKVHSRVVLLVAEAGYGKTTLLADFSRRTRVRVLWFRLDRGDRDWLGFLAHLVAAVRVHMPGFGSATAQLLREAPTSMPPVDAVLDTFLRELGSLPNDSTALIFDDVHLVDDSPDVKAILRELLARGPERMSFILASRREPPVRLARLRALGEVAELDTDDLRFDASETERLFSQTYALRLEPSVLAELNRRTEGWAASLQLVHAAIHDRNPSQVRTFIASLSGAEGHLYEYLAEEVVGDLPDDLQQFLMRTSILETVDLTLGPVAAGVSEEEARLFIDQAERYGLLGKRGHRARYVVRAHPLVRDFLLARLRRSDGTERVALLHENVARRAESIDWQVAARHYLASGKGREARRILSESLDPILARGAYTAATDIAASLVPAGLEGATGLVVESRLAQQRGELSKALEMAERARNLDPRSEPALLNLSAARVLAGDVTGGLDAALELEQSGGPWFGRLGQATAATMRVSVDGSLEAVEREVEQLAHLLRAKGATHYLGVSLLNHSYLLMARGDFAAALDSASESISLLGASSTGMELISAHIAHASALAFIGDIALARSEMTFALERSPTGHAAEAVAEVAEVEALVGDSRHGWHHVNAIVDRGGDERAIGEQILFARALLSMRDGDLARAQADVNHFRHGEPTAFVAFEAKRFLVEGLLCALRGVPDEAASVTRGTQLAAAQGARFWARYGELLAAVADHNVDPSPAIVASLAECPAVVSSLAETVLTRLPDLDAAAIASVTQEAERRPWRWRPSARRSLQVADPSLLPRVAALLERIGEYEDINRLHDAGHRAGGRSVPRLGVSLARRLANRVFVEDLGRLQIVVGDRVVEGSEVRRKVLALLCFLLSRPRYSSTRDEVLDNLWPEHDPTSALNSLNQTVYFLRRVFEPGFKDEVSPGYVGQDGETIWLDELLIDSRSKRCLQIIRSMPRDPTPEGSVALAAEYRGRFALDFAYEEWSVPYRDALHAAYLRVAEHAVRLDLDAGHFDRGTFIAERAAEIDPDSEEIQAALVRLYRVSGAHAAAAEQYAHYAHAMRDLGIEPPALTEV